MKHFINLGIGLGLFALCSCGQPSQQQESAAVPEQSPQSNQVVETIMARRSVRKYKQKDIENDKLQQILNCGIQAPNGMYKQSWELRVVNQSAFLSELEQAYTAFLQKEGRKRIPHPSFGAPCLIFIAHDTSYDLSQVDCGLLGENMILAAQSMGLGTCCLGGIVRFMNSPEAANLLKRMELPPSYKLLYAIAMGYPDESPGAKPRNIEKIKFVK